ncbi:MAG: ATP phosphoribosyltransferase [Actinomycetota bacterium]|nr:ATP phosphoribosyltransferase [Acidimicrobiaceae bacterium]MCH2621123.1 ATP phosphoribosyltransferase [Acidimicrobiales bacterium]MEC7899873.1 ATP phosphoribosyltransferase [Actinomycetota bacterium]
MLKIVLPKGSLEKATLELFESADLAVIRSSKVDYKAEIDDPRIDEVMILRPQEIPTYIADGLFDIGITGRDWIEETESDLVSLGKLHYSKATARPVNIVVAVPEDSPYEKVKDLPNGVKVSTEYPNLTKNFFTSQGIEAEVHLSYGATEAKAPDIVDVVVDLTETGRALKAAGLKIIDTIITSHTELVANRDSAENPELRHAMNQIHTLLEGTLEARGKVLVKMNVGTSNLEGVLEAIPSMKAPTVNELAKGEGYAVETVVAKSEINVLIPELRDKGASDIIELPLSKIVH